MLSQQRKYFIKKIALLGAPIAAGQVGHILTSLADTVMVGRLGEIPLAAVGFANAIFFVTFIFGIGVIAGIRPLVGKSDGENDKEKTNGYLIHGIIFSLIIGVLLTTVNYSISFLIPFMGQETAVVNEATDYYYWLTASIIPGLLFISLKNYLEGLGYTTPPMITSLLANLFNIVLNYILIFGKLGIEPMGIVGAGVATFISRILSLALMLGYSFYADKVKWYFNRLFSTRIKERTFNEIFEMGLPIGLQFFIEINAFTFGAVMAGWVGSSTQAAHHIVIQLCALTFLIGGGIGTAGTIIISNLMGTKEYKKLRFAGHTAFYMALAVMSVSAVLFTLGRNWLPTLVIDNAEVVAIAGGLLLIGALFQLVDGLQVSAISALRGIADVNVPTVIAFVAYWLIGIPTSYILAFKLNMGGLGIWWGYLTGLCVAALMLFARFQYATSKLIKQN